MFKTVSRPLARVVTPIVCFALFVCSANAQTAPPDDRRPPPPPGADGAPPPGPPPGMPPGVPAGTPSPDGLGVTVGPAPTADNIDEGGFGPWEDISVVQPLKQGEKIPDDVVLLQPDGTSLDLSDLVSQQPVLLIFYRGGWCPYCNVHLGELATIADELEALGYRIVAVSADTPEQLAEFAAEQSFDYQLLSDSGLDTAAKFGLRYKVQQRYLEHVKNDRGRDLEAMNGGYLLTPGAFLVDRSGTIRFTYVNNNFAVRIKPEKLLEAARSVND